MRQWVFCYGTLLEPALMSRIIGRRAQPLPAALPDHAVARLRGRDYPGIWRQPGSQTEGCCYRLHHRRELGLLDRYEGPEYRRRRVRVQTATGPLESWIYLPRVGRRGRGRPWSRQTFTRLALRRYQRQVARWRAAAIVGAGGHEG